MNIYALDRKFNNVIHVNKFVFIVLFSKRKKKKAIDEKVNMEISLFLNYFIVPC